MALKRLFQGRSSSRSNTESLYRETYYGTEAEVDTYIATLTIGSYDQTKGYLHEWSKEQENAAVWKVEVTYRISYEHSYSDQMEESTIQKIFSLGCRNIQKPLEDHPDYIMLWNHYLIGLGVNYAPQWALTATTPIIPVADREKYRWISFLSEMPFDRNEEGKAWEIVAEAQKPGVQYYDEACFTVTERAKYRTASAAGAAISHNINKIATPPETFGIIGGEWKLDEGSVDWDGNRYVATRVWTRADSWDEDLYGSSSSGA